MQALLAAETAAESGELAAELHRLGWRVHRVTAGPQTDPADRREAMGVTPAVLERVAAGDYELVWIQLPAGGTWTAVSLAGVQGRRDWAELLRLQEQSEGEHTIRAKCFRIARAAPTKTTTTVIESPSGGGSREDLLEGGTQERRRRSSRGEESAGEKEVGDWATHVTLRVGSEQGGLERQEVTLIGVGPTRGRLHRLKRQLHGGRVDVSTTGGHSIAKEGHPERREEVVARVMTGCDETMRGSTREEAAPDPTPSREGLQERANAAAAARLWAELTGAGEQRDEGVADGLRKEGESARGGRGTCQSRAPCLRSAPTRMPEEWPEAVDVQSTRVDQARGQALRYISRRRAVAETAEALFSRPIPRTDERPTIPARQRQDDWGWPAGAPPRPIRIEQLFVEGAYARLQAAIARVRADMQTAEEEWQAGGRHKMIPMRQPEVFTPEESQPEWARGCVWDTRDPTDCVPLQPYTEADPPEQEVNMAFFREWGAKLRWPDEDMLQQICVEGCASRSSCARASVVFAHHTGLREHYGPAREAVHNDTQNGWVTSGWDHPPTVPVRLVPKNVVAQSKWKVAEDGSLQQKQKWRVTTDDSMEAQGVTSRNDGIDRATISNLELPTITQLAEAVAIMQAATSDMQTQWHEDELQRVTMWALDLSDAYRRVAAARHEWWMQCFVWHDGVRLDKRCVFGSAHLVDFFQRVSTFVLAVAKHRISEYEDTHTYGEARREWVRRREQAGRGSDCFFAGIYLDDAFGASCEDNESTRAGDCAVSALIRVKGGRAELSLRVRTSRAAIHLAIVKWTFEEAGWQIATQKVQRGQTLDLLGLAVTAGGGGSLFIPEAKRRGLLADIAYQRRTDGSRLTVPRQEVERLVGRLSHVSIVVSEGNAYLQPMYRLSCTTVKRGVTRKQHDGSLARVVQRVKPRELTVSGDSKTAKAYQLALDWWMTVLSKEVSTPLAPMLTFPELGGPGSAFIFTDAARETGTGFGGFTMWEAQDRPEFWFMAERWDSTMLRALQQNKVSMPAGEAVGAVMLLDAVLSRAPEVKFAYCFTDSDATAKAITAAGSGAPQINFLVEWLLNRHRQTQFLGIHQCGVRNVASDRLSRGRVGEVVAEAAASGARIVRLDPPDCFSAVVESIRSLPLRHEG